MSEGQVERQETMEERHERLKKLSFEEVRARVSNKVYEATRLIEDLEGAGVLRCNGHHVRQRIAALATDELKSIWDASHPATPPAP